MGKSAKCALGLAVKLFKPLGSIEYKKFEEGYSVRFRENLSGGRRVPPSSQIVESRPVIADVSPGGFPQETVTYHLKSQGSPPSKGKTHGRSIKELGRRKVPLSGCRWGGVS